MERATGERLHRLYCACGSTQAHRFFLLKVSNGNGSALFPLRFFYTLATARLPYWCSDWQQQQLRSALRRRIRHVPSVLSTVAPHTHTHVGSPKPKWKGKTRLLSATAKAKKKTPFSLLLLSCTPGRIDNQPVPHSRLSNLSSQRLHGGAHTG